MEQGKQVGGLDRSDAGSRHRKELDLVHIGCFLWFPLRFFFLGLLLLFTKEGSALKLMPHIDCRMARKKMLRDTHIL